jgi:hypothetical protein
VKTPSDVECQTMKTVLCLVLPLAWLAAAASAGPGSLPKRLIMTGWDSPDTAQFRRELGSMEQWPFDGAVIYAQGHGADGRGFDSRAAFGTRRRCGTSIAKARGLCEGESTKENLWKHQIVWIPSKVNRRQNWKA